MEVMSLEDLKKEYNKKVGQVHQAIKWMDGNQKKVTDSHVEKLKKHMGFLYELEKKIYMFGLTLTPEQRMCGFNV